MRYLLFKEEDCPGCGGDGWRLADDDTCPVCEGLGWIYTEVAIIPLAEAEAIVSRYQAACRNVIEAHQ